MYLGYGVITKLFMSFNGMAQLPFFTDEGLDIPKSVALFDDEGKLLEVYDRVLFEKFLEKYELSSSWGKVVINMTEHYNIKFDRSD